MVRPRARGARVSLSTAVAGAYSTTGEAWQRGPGLVYDRLAEVLIDAAPVALAAARVLDLGAGTGAASRAAQARGAGVVAVDVAFGMLAAAASSRPPAAVGDALALPFADGSFDAVVAAFSLNHLADPVEGLREASRVTVPGGCLVASAYAEDDGHPARDAVYAASAARGWQAPAWIAEVSTVAVPRLATVERAAAVAAEAGLDDVVARHVVVPFPELTPAEMVGWRLGMAQLAPFVASLPAGDADALRADALERLGDPPMLERSIVVLSGRAPAATR